MPVKALLTILSTSLNNCLHSGLKHIEEIYKENFDKNELVIYLLRSILFYIIIVSSHRNSLTSCQQNEMGFLCNILFESLHVHVHHLTSSFNVEKEVFEFYSSCKAYLAKAP